MSVCVWGGGGGGAGGAEHTAPTTTSPSALHIILRPTPTPTPHQINSRDWWRMQSRGPWRFQGVLIGLIRVKPRTKTLTLQNEEPTLNGHHPTGPLSAPVYRITPTWVTSLVKAALPPFDGSAESAADGRSAGI